MLVKAIVAAATLTPCIGFEEIYPEDLSSGIQALSDGCRFSVHSMNSASVPNWVAVFADEQVCVAPSIYRLRLVLANLSESAIPASV